MKVRWMMCAVAVVVFSNIAVFIHVARSRGPEPFQTLELTERELPLVTQPGDKSETALRVDWRHRGSGPLQEAGGYRPGTDELRAVGFPCPLPAEEYQNRPSPLPRRAFVVFRLHAAGLEGRQPEGDPDAATEAATADEARQRAFVPDSRRRSLSRLAVVDIGQDLDGLRRAYPNPMEYPIFRGTVRARVEKRKDPSQGQREVVEWAGSVESLIPERLNVPRPHSEVLTNLAERRDTLVPRYLVTLKFDRNLEPWVDAVALVKR